MSECVGVRGLPFPVEGCGCVDAFVGRVDLLCLDGQWQSPVSELPFHHTLVSRVYHEATLHRAGIRVEPTCDVAVNMGAFRRSENKIEACHIEMRARWLWILDPVP